MFFSQTKLYFIDVNNIEVKCNFYYVYTVFGKCDGNCGFYITYTKCDLLIIIIKSTIQL